MKTPEVWWEKDCSEPGSQQVLASPEKPQPCEHKRRIDFLVASVAALASAAAVASLVGSEGEKWKLCAQERNPKWKKNLQNLVTAPVLHAQGAGRAEGVLHAGGAQWVLGKVRS